MKKIGSGSALWNRSCGSRSAGSNYWTFRESAETASKSNPGLGSRLVELTAACAVYTLGLGRVWRNRTGNGVTLEKQGGGGQVGEDGHAHAVINIQRSPRGAAQC